MSLQIYVDAYSGYKANERPIRFNWQEPNAEYFKVRTVDGKLYLLRYDEHADEWTLQSGFDGDELLDRHWMNTYPGAMPAVGHAVAIPV